MGAPPSLPTGTSVAIGVVVAALVVALCALYYCYRRYSNSSRQLLLDHHQKQGTDSLNGVVLSNHRAAPSGTPGKQDKQLVVHSQGYMAANI